MEKKSLPRLLDNLASCIHSKLFRVVARTCALASLITALLLTFSESTNAIPSFSRQTNMACNVCHTVFPRLTSFGRMFKMNGYSITGNNTIESKDDKGRTRLRILTISPTPLAP